MYKKVFSAVLAALMLLCLLSGCSGASSNSADEARSGVVRLFTIHSNGQLGVASAVGVGKAGEAPTYFVTNHHAVSEESGDVVVAVYILKDSYAVPMLPDGTVDGDRLDLSRMIACDVVYRATNGVPDLAVLRAANPVSGRTALPFAEAEKAVRPGDTVYALGYPASADLTTFTEQGGSLSGSVADLTVTDGIVSRLTEYGIMGNTRIIQHTAPINPGNSGGALVDKRGAVVGINTGSFNADGLDVGEQNHYVAIESEYVIKILDSLNIEYTMVGEFPVVAVIIAIAAIAIVVIVVVVVSKTRQPHVETHTGGTEVEPPVVLPQSDAGTTIPASQDPQTPVQPVTPSPSPNAGYRIQGITGTFANRRFAVKGSMRIGRDPSRNELVYPPESRGISGVHCVLVEDGETLLLQDLGSTYGTFVAGARIAASQAVALHKGDRFWLGSEQEAFLVDWKG